MSSQGPFNPTAAGQDATGTVSWTNPTNIEGTSAFATQSQSATQSDTTNNLQGTGFGFTIPAGSTINGITVSYDAEVSSVTSYTNEPIHVQLLKAGSAAGTAKTDTGNWTTSLATYTYGSGSDLWGTTWSASDINNSGFGFQINDTPDRTSGAIGHTQSVQNYKITVTYTSATVTALPSGVSMTSGVGSPSGAATATATPSGVSMTFAVATPTLFTYDGMDFGNVVGTSTAIPAGVNSSYFYVRATGYIVPRITGLYTLGVNSQDGCNLFLAGQPVFPNNLSTTQSAHSSAAYTQSGTVNLTAGVYYPVVVEWQHGSGASYECQMLWTPPLGSVQVIPPANLSVSLGTITGTLHSSWWNGTSGLWYPTGHASVDLTNQAIPNTPLDMNAQLMSQLRSRPLMTTGTFTVAGGLSQSGTSMTINIASKTAQIGSHSITYSSGSVTPSAYGTYYVYADDPTFAGGAVTYVASTNPLNPTASDNRISWGSITTASGGGGTGGSGGGGGGISCFSPNTRVQTQRGDVRFDELLVGDYLLTARGTWRRVTFVMSRAYNGTALDMSDGELVTPEHLFLFHGRYDAGWLRVDELHPEFPLWHYEGKIWNAHLETKDDDDQMSPHTEHSYVLANGHVVHNALT